MFVNKLWIGTDFIEMQKCLKYSFILINLYWLFILENQFQIKNSRNDGEFWKIRKNVFLEK